MKRPIGVLALAALLVASTAVADEAAPPRIGDATLFHSVMPTDRLPVAVAERYRLPRSARQGMLQVTLRSGVDGSGPAVAASVSGTVRGLGGQPSKLAFVEHRDGDESLYIAVFTLSRPDTLRFELGISIGGSAPRRVVLQSEIPAD